MQQFHRKVLRMPALCPCGHELPGHPPNCAPICIDARVIQVFVEGSRYLRTGDLVWPQQNRNCIRRMLLKDMEHPSHHRSNWREPVERCIRCGHLASEHGKTGTRPCLAMIGDLLDRAFCPCDELQITAAPGLPAAGLAAA